MAKSGYILLQGGAEFTGQMRVSDLRAVELAGGMQAPISIIPTAAAPDNNHERAGDNGRRWFISLGAQSVRVARIIDHGSANESEIAEQLGQSKLIYMLGGFPAYLADVLNESVCWHAMQAAYHGGAVLAGSSAGAMVLCQHVYDPTVKSVIQGLGLLSDSCILPHHNTFGQHWAPELLNDLPQTTLIGIDEQTGIINDGPKEGWNVYGKQGVTIYHNHDIKHYRAGKSFTI